MESSSFLERPHVPPVRILSWNINGVKTKLELPHVQQLLIADDIFAISELKANWRASFPGNVSYRSAMVGGRGGVAVFVRRHLAASVMRVDTAFTDQVWLQVACLAPFLLGFCYVPPSDSPYFDLRAFSNIQQKVKWCEEANMVPLVMGDVNCRFGVNVQNLIDNSEILPKTSFSYPSVADPVRAPNDNANNMAPLCIEAGLVVVNNLKYENSLFESKLTFKRRQNWISELDLCIIRHDYIRLITSFEIIHDL